LKRRISQIHWERYCNQYCSHSTSFMICFSFIFDIVHIALVQKGDMNKAKKIEWTFHQFQLEFWRIIFEIWKEEDEKVHGVLEKKPKPLLLKRGAFFVSRTTRTCKGNLFTYWIDSFMGWIGGFWSKRFAKNNLVTDCSMLIPNDCLWDKEDNSCNRLFHVDSERLLANRGIQTWLLPRSPNHFCKKIEKNVQNRISYMLVRKCLKLKKGRKLNVNLVETTYEKKIQDYDWRRWKRIWNKLLKSWRHESLLSQMMIKGE